jgi:Flp pilus assembly protein TadD
MDAMPAGPRVTVLIAALLAGLLAGCASLEGARLYRSGTLALDRGETSRAIADLERAARLVPEASEVQNHLGLAYAAAGREDEAGRAFRRAVELDCENAAAQANLRAFESARAGP